MLTLFSYNVSPYAAKVRAVLRYKGVRFEERIVHPLRRGELRRISGQLAVPVIVDDDGHVVADSTHIVAHLEQRYPEPPVLPRDPALRARALLLEEGFDEGLGRAIQPIRWMIPTNARRTAARFRAAYPPGLVDDLGMALVSATLRLDARRLYGSRSLAAPPAADLLARLGEVLDLIEAALADSGWLAGPAPSVADFALYGWLAQLEGLDDGWSLVQARQRVARLLQPLAEPAEQPTRSAERDAADHPRSVGESAQGVLATRP